MPKKLLLFDLATYGHHPSYIRCLLEYFSQQSWDLELEFIVSRHFFQKHKDVVQFGLANQINFTQITVAEQERFDTAKSQLGSDFFELLRSPQANSAFEIEFDLLYDYAQELKATSALCLYLDDGRLISAAKAKFPCPFSGIYFTPQFHYPQFQNHSLDRIRQAYYLQQKLVIARFLRHPQLHRLFCLDFFATEQIQAKYKTDKVVYLPDPVRNQKLDLSKDKQLKSSLNIEPKRKILLLFGSLAKRKGIYQVLQAILCLSPAECEKICLLLVGKAEPHFDLELLKIRVAWVREKKPVQIIEKYEFIADSEVLSYFQLADIVLAAYHRHAGMSGILFLAAIARKPVLSSNFGLMGEITRRHELGITVDTSIPEAVAEGLKCCLNRPPESLCNYTKMQELVAQHSPEKFAKILLNSSI
ncbi:MAG: glycosyltransferase [Oscillatoria sp. PMC 1068.18]|nr:glycosyltransferase [Oscillatoria sp. PMC 1076.18]MEC4988181.1 glycosyltransferase [Oscillatoria sp. PMC 1068.18]